MAENAPDSLLRDHADHSPVSFLELFFDLVYVFAITQLSHTLSEHLSLSGMIETGELFLAVWWAWMYTTWAANWADPERVPVRLLLIGVMLLSLVMAIATPHAFEDGGLLFAASYVALQLGRSVMMIPVFGRGRPSGARNMLRIALYFVISAVPWFVGAMGDPEHRRLWWGAALLIEYSGPLWFYYLPGLGASSPDDWDISGGHMAERGALFVIIALGEGIVVTGSAVSQVGLGGGRALAFALAFVGSVMMWWLYFDIGAARGTKMIEQHDEPGRVARAAYTYLHMPIIAGVIVSAVADALLLKQWHGDARQALVATQCGGMVIYLAGIAVFKRGSSARGVFPLSHIAGLSLMAMLGIVALSIRVPTLLFFPLSVAILAMVAVWEWGSFHGGWDRRLADAGLPVTVAEPVDEPHSPEPTL